MKTMEKGRDGRGTERAVGERSGAPIAGARGEGLPDPELVERPRRRRFAAEYKRRILRLADACGPGELGAMLRREGLYTSHLATWRMQHEQGRLAGSGPRRGRPAQDPLAKENEELRRRLARAEAELTKAHKVIQVQGNVSALLSELLQPRSATPDQNGDT
jgi:transposase-like protein